MDFFGNQERARKRTSLLVFYFIVAVVLIVAAINLAVAFGLAHLPPTAEERSGRARRSAQYQVEREGPRFKFGAESLALTTGLTLAVIGLGTLYRWLTLRSGGRAVAELAGGIAVAPNTTDPAQRRLLNVVEEMSIASGTPMPAVYVLENEAGINAFAAGFTPSDAAIAVTRGTLDRLSRDELQGVVAHEFSHILNGDMRLNIRLIGVLFGILMIAMIGRTLLHALRFSGGGSRRDSKGPGGAIVAIVALGLLLYLVGYVGYFFGRLIQAAVSRQREHLADAAAVQFTRNPAGIGGALKKIGGLALGSKIATEQATQIRHFFFAQAFDGGMLDSLSTHPPLAERIKAIEPLWDGKFVEPPPGPISPLYQEKPRPVRTPPPLPRAVQTAVLLSAIGAPTSGHLQRARAMLEALPPALTAAAREPAQALLVVFGLLAANDPAVRAQQFDALRLRHGVPFGDACAAFLPHLAGLPADLRLPLLNLALPALRSLPPAEIRGALETAHELIAADGEVTLFEFMVQKALERHVATPAAGAARGVINFYSFGAVRNDVAVLLSSLSRTGAGDAAAAERAFAAALARVPPLQGQVSLLPPDACGLDAVSAALDRLVQTAPAMRKILITAGAEAVAADGTVATEEAELLRAVADALDCPIPPIIAGVEAA